MKVGIYKITSPSNKVYIGQSWNLSNRYDDYRYQPDKKQRKIYNSIKKYGFKEHKFEIIHELPVDVTQEVMDRYEVLYWQLYKDCGIEMMNIKEPGKGGKHSLETISLIKEKKKLSNNAGKKIHSEEAKQKFRENMLDNTWAKGYKFTEEQRKNSSLSKVGRIMPIEGVQKSADKRRGAKRSLETKQKMWIKIGQYDLEGNFIREWSSCVEIKETLNINTNHIGSVCNGNRKSSQGFIWKHIN